MRFICATIVFHLVSTQIAYANDVMLLRLHGSNTIGAELGPELVKSWLYHKGYTDIRVKRIKSEEIEISARDLNGDKKLVEIHSHGSSTGFKSLKNGVADIGMSSRPIKSKENNSLKKFGDMTSESSEFVVGLDGIAVIVNKSNTISEIDKETINKVFSGKITQWSQLNERLSGKINVYARDKKSGTYDTFKALVLGKKTPLISTAKRYESNAELSDDVSKDIHGIGFVGLPYVRKSKALAVAEQGTLAKVPKSFDIATEDYALARRLYLYSANTGSNNAIKSFIDFSLSKKGQDVVGETGFISQNPRSQIVDLNSGFPEEYLNLTKQSERLSINFRFKKGTTMLDNKSKRDVKRLVDYVSKSENNSKKVMLFGFSESSESLPVFALDLSVYRVDWVSDLLVRKGIDPVSVRGYGDAIPVASNEDAGGRHKNRRVEVWLK